MILLNFSHPITNDQLAEIESRLEKPIDQVIKIDCQFEHDQPFLPQLQSVLNQVDFPAEDWQTGQFIINLPAFSPIAGVLLAELHGRMGYFPAIVRLKPVAGSLPPRFEVAELINLQDVRDQARISRL